MKKLFLILLMTISMKGQNLHTNAPQEVYPILEEFISENYQREQTTFERINNIDSIIVKNIPLIAQHYYIRKVYGYHHIKGDKEWIEIDSSLLKEPVKFAYTLLHELGHVFKQEHLDHEIYPKEIMSDEKYPYYIKPEDYEKAKKNFFNTIKQTQ